MIINDNEGDLGLCMASRTMENGDKFALLYFNLNRSYKYIQTIVKCSKIMRFDAASNTFDEKCFYLADFNNIIQIPLLSM